MKKVILLLSLISLTALPSAYAQTTDTKFATESSENIKLKVEQKINEVKKNPKAYIGIVTDKTEDTIQIKNDAGEIKLISIDTKNASYVKIDSKNQNAKYTDIAIGDYIIAMGFKNNNEVLDGKRILITSDKKEQGRSIIYGTNSGIDKKIITLTTNEGSELKYYFPKKWKGPEIKEILPNDKVILVSINEEGKQNIRTIEVITSGNN